jgi:lipopolysaccharide/colanic/teichoic acid biosynthesis glycosyltransferase
MADYGVVSGQKAYQVLLKRAADLFLGTLAVTLFSPVMCAIALLIKTTSKGPVLFRQERIGWGGRPFTFLKFRSMRTDCDERIHLEFVTSFITAQGAVSSGVYKITNDPRITPVGKFLRKTSLDELPQLINVLRGEMSLVGPRPPIAYEFALYSKSLQTSITQVLPGITGLWQVEGRSRSTFKEMMEMNIEYVHKWSFWLDLQILWRTVLVVMTFRGAY